MPNSSYRPEIDGLRALSVVAVLLFHANLGLPGGYIGVDVFFVISGYLITRIILNDIDAGGFSLAAFWERRIRRIFPALAVTVAGVLLAGYFLLLPSHLANLGRSSVAQSLLLANIYFWRDTGYFTAPAEQKPLLHTWSLAVEEQFYIVLPLLLLGVGRMAYRRLVPVLAGLLFISFVLGVYGAYRHPVASFFLLPSRAWEFLAGSLLVCVPESFRFRRAVHEGVAALGIVAIIASAIWFTKTTPFPGVAALLPVGGAAAFIFANAGQRTVAGRVFSLAPVVFIGRISYSLYLWHWPILVYLTSAFGKVNHQEVTMVALPLSFVVAALSWRWIEVPFRHADRATSRTRIFAGAAAVQCACMAAAALFWAGSGLPGRLPDLQKLVADIDGSHLEFGSFIPELEENKLPRIGRVDEPARRPDFVLFGDSHALAFAPLFDVVSRRHGLTGLVVAANGISPILLNEYDPSINVRKRNELFLELLSREHIRDVCLVVRWDWQIEKEGTSIALSDLLKCMERSDVERVFLFRQVPCQPLGNAYTQQIVAAFRFPRIVTLPRTSVEQYQEQRNRESEFLGELPTFETLQIELVDTARRCFDPNGHSRVMESGRALYYDDDHLSRYGAEVLLDETVNSVVSRIAERRQESGNESRGFQSKR